MGKIYRKTRFARCFFLLILTISLSLFGCTDTKISKEFEETNSEIELSDAEIESLEDEIKSAIQVKVNDFGSNVRFVLVSNGGEEITVAFTYNEGKCFPKECKASVEALQEMEGRLPSEYKLKVTKYNGDNGAATWDSDGHYVNARDGGFYSESGVTLFKLSGLEMEYNLEKQTDVMEPTTEKAGYIEKVWVSSSGTKYHRRSSCSGMESPRQVTLERAKEMGYTACGKCY